MKQAAAAAGSSAKKIIVLGIGNRLMGDDGIGVRIVEALKEEEQSGDIRFTAGETDIGYCLDALAEGEFCVIVDGACTGQEPCTVSMLDLKEVLAQKRSSLCFHDFDLICAMKRENMIKDGVLITVEVGSVEFSADLSPLMLERFGEIVRKVKEILGNCECRSAGIPTGRIS